MAEVDADGKEIVRNAQGKIKQKVSWYPRSLFVHFSFFA